MEGLRVCRRVGVCECIQSARDGRRRRTRRCRVPCRARRAPMVYPEASRWGAPDAALAPLYDDVYRGQLIFATSPIFNPFSPWLPDKVTFCDRKVLQHCLISSSLPSTISPGFCQGQPDLSDSNCLIQSLLSHDEMWSPSAGGHIIIW